MSGRKENAWNTRLSLFPSQRERRPQKVITFWYQRTGSSWSLRPQKYSSTHSLLLQRFKSSFSFCVYMCVYQCSLMCVLWVRRLLCIMCVCILFVDLSSCRSLYTSENNGNVYSNSGFHLVDALSWLQTWTGAVRLKMNALAPTSFSNQLWHWWGRGGGCRDSLRVLLAQGQL